MAIDGLLLHTLTNKLNQLTPCKIGKMQNVSDEEILFHIHPRKAKAQRLVINVHSNTSRVYISKSLRNTQPSPSNFVMVLRKQCSQAIITKIEQIGFDRIVRFDIEARNEFQDISHLKLYAELMGKYANLVLVDEKDIIIDALKRIPVFENSKRLVHPGAKYTLPRQPLKQDPRHIQSLDLDQSLVDQVYGFSPLLSKEFIYRLHKNEKFEDILEEIFQSNQLYVYDKDFHCIELKHLEKTPKVYDFMDGLDHLFIEKEQKQRIKEQCGDVFKTVDKELTKLKKKLPKLEESLHESQDYMKYKEYGDLLFAYQSQIKKEKIIRLESFETGKMIEIPLDMRFDIKDNANKFYQKYHKLKRGEIILQEQIVQCRKEIEYFEQLQQQLKFCSVEDALEIREELIKQRVLMPKKINQRQKKKKEPNILKLVLPNAEIYVGKNNIQNNYITHHLSRKQDMWFHVKDYHGSHVLIKTDELNEELIRMCANLAAYYSKGKESSSVPVDYCPISQIKKVPGSKIGFVTMKSYKTIYIDPDARQIEEWIHTYAKKG